MFYAATRGEERYEEELSIINCQKAFNASATAYQNISMQGDVIDINLNMTNLTNDGEFCGFESIELTYQLNETLEPDTMAFIDKLQLVDEAKQTITIRANNVKPEDPDIIYLNYLVQSWWLGPKIITLEVDLVELMKNLNSGMLGDYRAQSLISIARHKNKIIDVELLHYEESEDVEIVVSFLIIGRFPRSLPRLEVAPMTGTDKFDASDFTEFEIV
jgi:hypothetical protein